MACRMFGDGRWQNIEVFARKCGIAFKDGYGCFGRILNPNRGSLADTAALR